MTALDNMSSQATTNRRQASTCGVYARVQLYDAPAGKTQLCSQLPLNEKQFALIVTTMTPAIKCTFERIIILRIMFIVGILDKWAKITSYYNIRICAVDNGCLYVTLRTSEFEKNFLSLI